MSNEMVQLNEAARVLHAASRVLIVSHFNPDADALGSSCGLGEALRRAGKYVVVANESPIAERFLFIPGSAQVVSIFPEEEFDVVCICDCGDISRVGDKFLKRISAQKSTINFDHHRMNGMFGSVNVVDETACSTSEIVFRLLKVMKLDLVKPVAECLYTGILGDTGSFMYGSTNATVFGIAQELLHAGVDPAAIASKTFDNWSPERLRLFGLAISAIAFHRDGEIAEIVITPEMFEKSGASPDDGEGIVERARGVRGVRVAIVATVLPDLIKVSMRASEAAIDLSRVAREFGGGGHKAAAAFRWRRTLSGMRESLLVALAEELKGKSHEHA